MRKPQFIKIKVSEDGKVDDRLVEAEVIGGWAVHEKWQSHPDDQWSITHVRSGMALGGLRFAKKGDALMVARAVNAAVGDCEITPENAEIIGAMVATFRQAAPGGEWRRGAA